MSPYAGLYIHVPFCRAKCPYCDFYSLASGSLVSDWLQAVGLEMAAWKDRFPVFDTLYLGGGTPSFLSEEGLVHLMDRVFRTFSLASDSEISIEANPLDLTRQKTAALKRLGFNRINVGVQSFDDRALGFLGRTHRSADAAAALSRIRSAGFDNLGIDLIYGLPVQDLGGWFETLGKALSFQPEHLSCYQLTLERRTVFWQMKERGRLVPIDERMERAFFLGTSRLLERRGYDHYEISNFSRGPLHTCRHNEKYWHHVPYLGLGPSAHSFMGDTRWWNVRSVRKYCRSLNGGQMPVEGRETLSRAQLDLESVALGLRTRKGFGRDEISGSVSQENLADLEARGLVRCDGQRVIPTRRGFLVAERLPLYLCA